MTDMTPEEFLDKYLVFEADDSIQDDFEWANGCQYENLTQNLLVQLAPRYFPGVKILKRERRIRCNTDTYLKYRQILTDLYYKFEVQFVPKTHP